jgi:hypothetical protein
MRRARLATVTAIALLAALLAVPGGVLAAGVTVTGTVVRDGAPVTGVDVVVSVTGTDTVVSATTDENGAFSVDLEAGVGDQVQAYATGQTFSSEPDERGCVQTETLVGRAAATIDALPPAPLAVALDQVLTTETCTATATPRVTPPATDVARGERPGGTSGGGLLVVLAAIALAAAGAPTLLRRRP